MSKAIIYQNAKYVKSAVELAQLPTDEGAEVAFIGRSNAGKSSALNTITNIKGLARVSKTPGRTQAINVFALSNNQRLMDLPGYGYAKVPRTIKERWEKSIDEYLQKRQSLKGLIVIMDIRHPLKELDQRLIEWAAGCELPVHVLLSKADKLKFGASRKVLKEVEEALTSYGDLITVQLFSSQDQNGLEAAREVLDQWLEPVAV